MGAEMGSGCKEGVVLFVFRQDAARREYLSQVSKAQKQR